MRVSAMLQTIKESWANLWREGSPELDQVIKSYDDLLKEAVDRYQREVMKNGQIISAYYETVQDHSRSVELQKQDLESLRNVIASGMRYKGKWEGLAEAVIDYNSHIVRRLDTLLELSDAEMMVEELGKLRKDIASTVESRTEQESEVKASPRL